MVYVKTVAAMFLVFNSVFYILYVFGKDWEKGYSVFVPFGASVLLTLIVAEYIAFIFAIIAFFKWLFN